MTLWEREKGQPCYCNTADPLKERGRILHLFIPEQVSYSHRTYITRDKRHKNTNFWFVYYQGKSDMYKLDKTQKAHGRNVWTTQGGDVTKMPELWCN